MSEKKYWEEASAVTRSCSRNYIFLNQDWIIKSSKGSSTTSSKVLFKIQQLLKPATVLKVTLLYGRFSRFLNCTNGTKSRKALHIVIQSLGPFLEMSLRRACFWHKLNFLFSWHWVTLISVHLMKNLILIFSLIVPFSYPLVIQFSLFLL